MLPLNNVENKKDIGNIRCKRRKCLFFIPRGYRNIVQRPYIVSSCYVFHSFTHVKFCYFLHNGKSEDVKLVHSLLSFTNNKIEFA